MDNQENQVNEEEFLGTEGGSSRRRRVRRKTHKKHRKTSRKTGKKYRKRTHKRKK